MIQLRILFVILLTLIINPFLKAEDITEFEIEGISVGDSALNYFSEKEIKDKKQNYYNDDKFIPSEFEYLKIFKTYDAIQISYKKNDPNYKIYAIAGFLDYPNNIKKCFKKMQEISEEISEIFISVQKKDFSFKHQGDPSGNSVTKGVIFDIDSGSISIGCDDWSNEIGYLDVLRIDITSKEFQKWINEKAYK